MAERNPGLSAHKEQSEGGDRLIKVFIYLGAVCALLVVTLLVMFFRRTNSFNVHAFRVPSDSMCPTLCSGDRLVADMDAFVKSGPQRGDVIMMKHQMSAALYIKRVIGVGGDVVSESGGKILVNGKPLVEPEQTQGCGKTGPSSSPNKESVFFEPVKVPASSFFVIGDNLSNSYDSRIAGFGFVSWNQVRGRPIFLYWSPDSSRIGCAIH
jgi:signal peptidase I